MEKLGVSEAEFTTRASEYQDYLGCNVTFEDVRLLYEKGDESQVAIQLLRDILPCDTFTGRMLHNGPVAEGVIVPSLKIRRSQRTDGYTRPVEEQVENNLGSERE